MKKSTTIVLVIIVLVIVSIALLYSADKSHMPAQTAPVGTTGTSTVTGPNTTTPAPLPSDFKSYTSAINKDSFTFSYPADIATLTAGNTNPTQGWSYNATSAEPGSLDVTVDIPASFEPKTNFGDARFTVGSSATNAALTTCFAEGQNPDVSEITDTVNGVGFTKFTYNDAGAGQIYNITDYRTLSGGKCFSVQYVIHSANLGNYDPSQGITAFDEAKVQTLLEQMVSTFKFN